MKSAPSASRPSDGAPMPMRDWGLVSEAELAGVATVFAGNPPACPRVSTDLARKRAAIACYPTQLLALEDDWQIGAKLDAAAPEQLWRLAAPPPGWPRLST